MEELAGGNFAVVLPGLGRKDELGAVAAAVEKFKVVSEQKAREEAEAKIKQDQIAAQQRKADMVKLADSFEAAVGEIVETVSSASTELEASAGTLTATAERAQEVTITVAAASEEASTNVQSVASATEELSSSVNEISRQVQESARMAGEAVDQARHRLLDRVRAVRLQLHGQSFRFLLELGNAFFQANHLVFQSHTAVVEVGVYIGQLAQFSFQLAYFAG